MEYGSRFIRKCYKKYKPTAVIVVHLYGLTAQIDRIKVIYAHYNIALIEDAAESLGTTYYNQWTGTFGDFGIFSFNGNKIITTSGGGMLVSNNEAGIAKAKYWATQAREPYRHYEHKDIGYNYRLSNILAGIGRGQLKVLENRVQKKRQIFKAYRDGLSDIHDITFIDEREGERSNYWLSTLVLLPQSLVTTTMIIESLEAENIESRPVWKPMHMQPVFNKYEFVGNGRSERLFKYGICLPSDTKMTDEEIKKVISIIKGLWAKE